MARVSCSVLPGSGLKARLESHQRELLDTLESRFELPAELLSLNVLDRMELADLEETNNVYKRNKFILKALRGKPPQVVHDFITSLNNTEQQHVASYLRGIDMHAGIKLIVILL